MVKRGKYKVKTREELNTEYLANGDFDNLLINNTPFIRAIAKTFHQPDNLDDLIQEGNIALYRAFTTFNPKLGKPFLGYAKPIILNAMRSWLKENSNTIKTPANLIGSDDIIQTISISTPVDENNTPLSEFIPSEVSTIQNETSIVKMALNGKFNISIFEDIEDDIIKIIEKIKKLTDKERNLIEKYYLSEYTLDEIAKINKVSKQAIQQKIKKILKKKLAF